MATAQATIIKNELNGYVSNLHEYLGPYCFTKGAFVIEDNGTLLALLNENKRTQINGVFKSHKAFLPEAQPIFECDVNLILKCKNCQPGTQDEVRVKNIKWYPFKQGLKDYIYFKLEGHPTFSSFGIVNFAHAIQYIKRHILGKNEGTCKKRREDCKSDNKCLSNAKELNHKKYQLSQTVPVDITESYTRVGDEMFIPLEVSTFFLMNKDKKMNFQFVEGTVTITPDTAPIAEVISQSQVKQEEQEPDDVYDAVEVEGNSPVKVGGKMPRKSMPYTIRKLPNRRLYTVKGPGRTFAKGTTLEKAKKQVRLLYSIDRRNAKGTRRQK